MSRSNNTESIKNPAKKFISWKSSKKTWVYYDKEAEKNKELPINTPFIVLDVLSTATGYNDRKKCGVWANEVRKPSETMELKDKDGIVAKGPWRDIKEKVMYAKFSSSVYAMAKIGDGYELVNFQINGSALGAWIEFTKELGGPRALFGDVVLAIKDTAEGRKGSVTYTSPVFGVVSQTLSDEAKQQAENMDKELQAYLSVYFESSPHQQAARKHSEATQAYEPEPTPEPTIAAGADYDDDIPF